MSGPSDPQPDGGTEKWLAGGSRPARAGSKTAGLLTLAAERHGPLAGLPLGQVSKIATTLAPEADLHPGSARAALLKAVRAAQDGDRS